MQRQSLGSPTSKLHIHGGEAAAKNETTDTKRKDSPCISISETQDDYQNHKKTTKPRRFSSPSSSPSISLTVSPATPEKLIHLVPLLTLLCFFVLYLVSHNPSPSDLAHFKGIKASATHIDDSSEIGDVSRVTDSGRRGDVLVIRSFRNLQEIADKRKTRSHRKISDF